MQKTVKVELDTRSYDIQIGPNVLDQAGALISEIRPNAKCAIVTDQNVADLHLVQLQTSLEENCLLAGSVIIPAGEGSKSFTQLAALCEKLLRFNIERGDLIIAFGGGVIGDLSGFAASILRRGVSLIQMPTTLLAQVDSSVGGKTGINSPQGKNLIGTFYQPSLVLADTQVLDTLSAREFCAGYAEVIKYGLLGDRAFFVWLEEHWEDIFKKHNEPLTKVIETCCQAKAHIVAKDEKEAGQRALLNLGHTFGHAIEAWAGYTGRVLHGEAVAVGMCLAFEFSEDLELCPSGLTERVRSHLKNVGLPTKISDINGADTPSAEMLLEHMMQDKKVKAGQPAFILVHDIGEAFVKTDVSLDKVKSFLHKAC